MRVTTGGGGDFGVCRYQYVAPEIPPVGPTPKSPPPPVVTLIPPTPPKVNPAPGTATDGPEEARARGPPRLRARRAPRPFPVRSICPISFSSSLFQVMHI